MKYKKTVTLAYVGLLLILGGLFFPRDGECAEIKLDDPPAHWKVGPKLKKEWKNRRLLIPSKEIRGFPSKAVVVLAYLGQSQWGTSVKWPRVAFVIGDGTLILTAAHCVADFNQGGMQATSLHTIVISPYYGDVFEFDILAIDKEADLAILKAPWAVHPALVLGSEEGLKKAKELLAVGYPPPKVINQPEETIEPPYSLLHEVRAEKLPVYFETGNKPNQAITLEGTRFIGNGWSGSAMVLPETGEVVGIVCNLSLARGDVVTKIFGLPIIRKKGLLVRRKAEGCSVQSIRTLLGQHGLGSAVECTPFQLKPIEKADDAFSLAMDYIEAYLNEDLVDSLAVAQKLVELRPESVQAHLFLANSAFCIYSQDSFRKDLLTLAESNFTEALRLEPDNAHAHTFYANLLTQTKRHKEALAETEVTLTIDPNDQLAMVNQMLILTNSNPTKAEKLGQRLTEKYPNNAHYWFSYSNALSTLDRNEEALKAAQRAVDLKPAGLYRGRLAEALENAGRLDEAEENFRKMTEDCGCQRCWFQYGRFLITHCSDKLDEAEKALNLAAESKKIRRVPQKNLTNLRYSLIHAKLEYAEKQSPEKAETLARELLKKSPKNAQYWFELAGILRTLGKYQEALQAAQNAVNLAPEQSYRPRLANILAKAGQLDTAEQTYKEMLHDHPERPKYWFWYAKFLNEYYPDRIADVQEALSKAQPSDKSWSVPADELRQLYEKLSLKTSSIVDCNELNSTAEKPH